MADYITHEDYEAGFRGPAPVKPETTIDSVTDEAMSAYSLRWGISDPELRKDARKVIRAAVARAWERRTKDLA
jgi:hypothetical protein